MARRASPEAREALATVRFLQQELAATRRLAMRAIKLAFGLAPGVLLACFGIHAAM